MTLPAIRLFPPASPPHITAKWIGFSAAGDELTCMHGLFACFRELQNSFSQPTHSMPHTHRVNHTYIITQSSISLWPEKLLHIMKIQGHRRCMPGALQCAPSLLRTAVWKMTECLNLKRQVLAALMFIQLVNRMCNTDYIGGNQISDFLLNCL